MEITRFSKTYSINCGKRQVLFFSTKSACKLLLDRSILTAIDENTLSEKESALLSDLGFLVPDRSAELLDIQGNIDKQNDLNTALSITVVMNLDCNFSCTYCYEGSRKGHKYMTEKTAEHLLQFIATRFTDKKDTLVVDFFGGEPLLSLPLIERLSLSLQSFAQSRKATYFSTIVTNGSLLKRPVAEKLFALGLRSAKITLDGPAYIHNKYRPFKTGAGSFDIILKNIEDCCDLIKINIGGNFNKDTYPEFVSLLDILEARGLTPNRIPMLKFDPTLDAGEPDPAFPEYRSGCISINEPWILEAEQLLREEILKRGYKTHKVGPLLCAIEHRDQFVVNWNGDICKCPGFLGHKQYVIGNVQTEVEDYSSTYNLDVWKREPCLSCEYLPMCFGGCRFWTFIRNGRIDTIDCKKPYLDAQLETLIKQDIKYQLK